MWWLGYFILAFLGVAVFLILALLFSQTHVKARVDLENQMAWLVDAAFLLRVVKVQFRASDDRKRLILFLGGRPIFQKHLSSREKQPVSSGKAKSKSPAKKKSSLWKQRGRIKAYWAALKVFLRRFLKSLHGFRLDGHLTVGLGSPSQTGLLLGAWYSVKNWLPRERVTLQPDFLGKKAEGWLSTEWRVRLIHLAWVGVPFYWKIRRIGRAS